MTSTTHYTEESLRQDLTSPHSSHASPKTCIGITAERAYYHGENLFIKRSLRPREFKTGYKGLHIPCLGKERLQNEAAALRFLHGSEIPVPAIYAAFEIDDAFFLVTEFVDGTPMSELADEEKRVVSAELEEHVVNLHEMKAQVSGLEGVVIPPYRVMRQSDEVWATQRGEYEYVFCHNDLSQQNVIVDLASLKIMAIIDWEYAGFFPEYFEAPFYRRLGPSVAMDGEHGDVPRLLRFLAGKDKYVDANELS